MLDSIVSTEHQLRLTFRRTTSSSIGLKKWLGENVLVELSSALDNRHSSDSESQQSHSCEALTQNSCAYEGYRQHCPSQTV